jgi:Homing endonuclease associated repeat
LPSWKHCMRRAVSRKRLGAPMSDRTTGAYRPMQRRTPRYTWNAERVISALQDWAREFGGPPRAAEWVPEERAPDAISKQQESSPRPSAAGTTPARSRRSTPSPATTDARPPIPKWNRSAPDHPSAITVHRLFGSWSTALAAAGLNAHQISWNRETIATALRDWTTLHGQPPSRSDWIACDPTGTRPVTTTVHKHFGSWQTALRSAGIFDRSKARRGIRPNRHERIGCSRRVCTSVSTRP